LKIFPSQQFHIFSQIFFKDLQRPAIFSFSSILPGNFPKFTPKPNTTNKIDLARHTREWNNDEISNALKQHSIFSWGASDAYLASCVQVDHAEGIYIHDKSGKRYIDWSSGAVCTNLGHTVPEEIKKAVQDQLNSCAFVYGDLASTDARSRLCSLLAELCPGDINGFFFASSGAEANEAAIRMARRFTGRTKIMSRPRSYHGGTVNALNMTGDARRWYAEPYATGFVKMAGEPFPTNFKWDDKDESVGVQRSLNALHEQILYEGPNTIAAIFLEPVSGANGWLKPSTQWMQGVRALCDKYGILMVSDEVMTGFGRVGKMFGFELFDGQSLSLSLFLFLFLPYTHLLYI
jgi:taurine--2-oxoglutarate transaminase